MTTINGYKLNDNVARKLKEISKDGKIDTNELKSLKKEIELDNHVDDAEKELLDSAFKGKTIKTKDLSVKVDGKELDFSKLIADKKEAREAFTTGVYQLYDNDGSEGFETRSAAEFKPENYKTEKEFTEAFMEHSKHIFHVKLGLKEDNLGAISKNLFTFYNTKDPIEKAKSLLFVMVRINDFMEQKGLQKGENGENGEKVKPDKTLKALQDFKRELNEDVNKFIKKLPDKASNGANIIQKLFLDGAKSDGRIKHIANLSNDDFNLKDVRAMYELINDLGPDAKALLPKKAQDFIDRTQLLMGEGFMKHIKSALPLGENSDIMKSALKFMTASDGADKIAAGLDFVKATGVQVFGKGGKFETVMEFLKMDSRTTDAFRTAFNSTAAGGSRTEAIKYLGEHYKEGLEKMKKYFASPADAKFIEETSKSVLKKVGENKSILTEQLPRIAKEMELELLPEEEKVLAEILSKSDKVDEAFIKKALSTIKSLGKENASTALKMLKEIDPKIASKIFTLDTLGPKFLKAAVEYLPKFMEFAEKVGMKAIDAIPLFAKGLGKAIPVAGGLVSGYDTVRMGTIATTGEWSGKKYKDPEVRALAAFGTMVNGVDTALAVIECTGVGNVDFPIQLGLAGAEVAIDLMVEYYNEHPEKMTPEMRTAIKAGALLMATNPTGMAMVASIYGVDGTIDIANELTKLTAKGAGKVIDKITEVHAKSLELGADVTIDSLNLAADMIRNPEVYAQKLGKTAEEVVAMAKDNIKSGIAKGGELAMAAANVLVEYGSLGIDEAKKAFAVLDDIAQNPGKYGEKALNYAIGAAKVIGVKLDSAKDMAINFISTQIEKGGQYINEGVNALMDMGGKAKVKVIELMNRTEKTAEEIGSALKDYGKRGVAAAKEVFTVLDDISKNPDKYGEKAVNYAIDVARDIGKNLEEARDMAINFISTQIDKGGQYIKEGISALMDMGGKAVDKAKTVIKDCLNKTAETAKEVKEFIIDVANNPEKYKDKAVNFGKEVMNAVIDSAMAGGKYAYQVISEMPDKAKELFVNTVNTVVSKGEEAIKFIQSIDVEKLMKSLGDKGKAVLSRVHESITNTIKEGKELAGKAMDALGDFYDKTTNYIADLTDRTGKALGRFGDTIVDLAKGGVDLTEKIVKRYAKVASDKIPELMAAINNFNKAPVDLMVKIAKWEVSMAKDVINSLEKMGVPGITGLKQVGKDGIEAMKRLVLEGGEMSTEAWNNLKAMGGQGIDAIREIGLKSKKHALEAIETLSSMGNSAIAAIRDIGTQFHEYADEAIDTLKGMGVKAVNSIKAIGEKYKDLQDTALKAFQSMGSVAKDAIIDWGKRGIGKAQEVILDMAKTYDWAKKSALSMVETGQMALSKVKTAGSEIISYIQNNATVNTLKDMIKQGVGDSKQIMNILWNKGAEGLKALSEVYNHVKGAATEVLNFVLEKLKTAWDSSSFSDGYKGLRDMISNLYDEASKLGGTAAAEAKKMIYDAVKYLDKEVAGDYIPDKLYEGLK